jgi:predicted RNA binding protein YcfA (HicA-like mRNA interferase family)
MIRALERAGFVLDRIRGSHYILYKNNTHPPISIPMHNRDMKIGTLHAILRAADLTVEELLKLL